MNKYLLGCLLSGALCVVCILFASRHTAYTLYDVASYWFAAVWLTCLLRILPAR